MIISSELTGKTYKTVEDCLRAEKEHKEAEQKKLAEQKAHEEKLNKAYDEAIAACNRYFELAGVNFKVLEDKDKVSHNDIKFIDSFDNLLKIFLES